MHICRVLQITQMNLLLSCVRADQAVLGSTKTSHQNLKYNTSEGGFLKTFYEQTTPPIVEMIWGKNVGVIMVCGFFNSLKGIS